MDSFIHDYIGQIKEEDLWYLLIAGRNQLNKVENKELKKAVENLTEIYKKMKFNKSYAIYSNPF